MSQGAGNLIAFERGIDLGGDDTRALYARGECAQRIDEMRTFK